MSGASPWPQEYYNALRFYYWEPQWLNRHANASRKDRTCAEVMGNLGRSEVSLNHLLRFFFSLAPAALVARLFAAQVPGWTPERLESQVGPTLDVAKSIDICQPDFIFTGLDSIVALEMKVGHKASVEQAIKYALFLHHFGATAGSPLRMPFLLFMAPSCGRLWKRGLTFASFAAALDGFEFTPTIRRFAEACGHSRADVLALASALPMSHLTYGDLALYLRGEAAALDGSEGSETLRQLICGLLAELVARGLADEGATPAFLPGHVGAGAHHGRA